MNGFAFVEIGNINICGMYATRQLSEDFPLPILIFLTIQKRGIIILMLNMEKLKHKKVKYITKASTFKLRSVLLKNYVLFPIGIVSQEQNRF